MIKQSDYIRFSVLFLLFDGCRSPEDSNIFKSFLFPLPLLIIPPSMLCAWQQPEKPLFHQVFLFRQ